MLKVKLLDVDLYHAYHKALSWYSDHFSTSKDAAYNRTFVNLVMIKNWIENAT